MRPKTALRALAFGAGLLAGVRLERARRQADSLALLRRFDRASALGDAARARLVRGEPGEWELSGTDWHALFAPAPPWYRRWATSARSAAASLAETVRGAR